MSTAIPIWMVSPASGAPSLRSTLRATPPATDCVRTVPSRPGRYSKRTGGRNPTRSYTVRSVAAATARAFSAPMREQLVQLGRVVEVGAGALLDRA